MRDLGAGGPHAGARPLHLVHGRAERLILGGLHGRKSAGVGRGDGLGGGGLRFGITHACLWERLARKRTRRGHLLGILARKHGKGVALQCTRRLLPLLLLPLLLLALLLLPLLLRPLRLLLLLLRLSLLL